MPEKDKPREAEAPEFAPPPAKSQAKAELKTPEEWAVVCGERAKCSFEQTVTYLNGKPFDVVGEFGWRHEAAAVLHGWAGHAHHAGEPIRLPRADYEAALEAASKTDSRGEYVPHKAALSPHKGA